MKDIWVIFFKTLAIVLCNLFIFGLCIMLLWNTLVVSIFNMPYINYWQSIGLCILTNILFKPWGTADDKD